MIIFCDKPYCVLIAFLCLSASMLRLLYMQSCEDELDDVPGDGKRKRNFRSLNQDADDAYSYGPIHVVHTDKLHCSQVLLNHSALDLLVEK